MQFLVTDDQRQFFDVKLGVIINQECILSSKLNFLSN